MNGLTPFAGAAVALDRRRVIIGLATSASLIGIARAQTHPVVAAHSALLQVNVEMSQWCGGVYYPSKQIFSSIYVQKPGQAEALLSQITASDFPSPSAHPQNAYEIDRVVECLGPEKGVHNVRIECALYNLQYNICPPYISTFIDDQFITFTVDGTKRTDLSQFNYGYTVTQPTIVENYYSFLVS